MSEAASALQGAAFEGYVMVREAGLRGMITLRGDLGSAAIRTAATAAAGVGFPGQGAAVTRGERGILWMSPDEVMVLCPHGEVTEAAAAMAATLAGTHHLLADVSDARALFSVEGGAVREVLAKLTPADLSPEAFGPGRLRRTRLAQVPAALWMPEEARVELVCFRSVAQYVFDILTLAAKPGSEVGYF